MINKSYQIMSFFILFLINLSMSQTFAPRPRLFIDNQKLQSMCGVAHQKEYPTYWQLYQQEYTNLVNYEKGRTVTTASRGWDLIAQALLYQASGDVKYAQNVISAIGHNFSEGREFSNFNVAVAFDYVYDQMTSSQREAAANQLESLGDDIYNDPNYGPGSRINPYWASLKQVYSLAAIGISLYGMGTASQDVKAINYLNYCDTILKNYFFPGWEQIYSDGTRSIGSYNPEAIGWIVMMVGALETGSSYDYSNFAGYVNTIKNDAYWWAYSSTADRQQYFIKKDQDNGHYGTEMMPYQWLSKMGYVGQKFGSSCIEARILKTLLNQLSNSDYYTVFEILFGNNAQPMSLSDLPNAYFFYNSGQMYFRSDWNYDDKSIVIRTLGGYQQSSHHDSDNGAFTIMRGNDLLVLDAGYYDNASSDHSISFHIRTIAHAMFTVYDDNMTYCSSANDGGLARADWPTSLVDNEAWQSGGDMDLGNSIRHLIDNNVYYNKIDLTTGFNRQEKSTNVYNRVYSAQRSFLWMGNKYLLVYDYIHQYNQNMVRRWSLPLQVAPTIDGTWNGGVEENSYGGTPLRTSNNSNRFNVSVGNSMLYGYVLLPESSDRLICKIGGPDASGNYNNANSYEFYYYYDQPGSGQRNHYSSSTMYPEEGRYRLEIKDTNSNLEGRFFVVLQVDASSSVPVECSLVQGRYNDQLVSYGTTIENRYFAFFSKDNKLIKGLNFSLNTKGDKDIFLSDLEVGYYNIFIDGKLISRKMVNEGSHSIHFLTNLNGNFQVTQIDNTPPSKPKRLRIIK